jgi:hypothetical protein
VSHKLGSSYKHKPNVIKCPLCREDVRGCDAANAMLQRARLLVAKAISPKTLDTDKEQYYKESLAIVNDLLGEMIDSPEQVEVRKFKADILVMAGEYEELILLISNMIRLDDKVCAKNVELQKLATLAKAASLRGNVAEVKRLKGELMVMEMSIRNARNQNQTPGKYLDVFLLLLECYGAMNKWSEAMSLYTSTTFKLAVASMRDAINKISFCVALLDVATKLANTNLA